MAERVGFYSTLKMGKEGHLQALLLLSVNRFILLDLEHNKLSWLLHLALVLKFAIRPFPVAKVARFTSQSYFL
jgi:hypothetical protein